MLHTFLGDYNTNKAKCSTSNLFKDHYFRKIKSPLHSHCGPNSLMQLEQSSIVTFCFVSLQASVMSLLFIMYVDCLSSYLTKENFSRTLIYVSPNWMDNQTVWHDHTVIDIYLIYMFYMIVSSLLVKNNLLFIC